MLDKKPRCWKCLDEPVERPGEMGRRCRERDARLYPPRIVEPPREQPGGRRSSRE